MKLVNLIPLHEIDFKNQDQFDAYSKVHKLRPSTKISIDGRVTTVGQATKNSEPIKGSSIFGGNSDSSTPKSDGMADANSIASATGMRASGVASWADENNVDLSKVSDAIKSKKLNPKDMFTAVIGNPGNKFAKDIIKKYSYIGPKPSPKADPMVAANSIASATGMMASGIVSWADENGVDLSKVSTDIDSKKLNPKDMFTAVIGTPGNKYAKDIISKYSQGGNDVGKREHFKPYVVKDSNNPNFLKIHIEYPEGDGTLTALGQRTMSGQQRDAGATKAMKIAKEMADKLEKKYNIEDIDITDNGDGKVVVFAVSDDFIKNK